MIKLWGMKLNDCFRVYIDMGCVIVVVMNFGLGVNAVGCSFP